MEGQAERNGTSPGAVTKETQDTASKLGLPKADSEFNQASGAVGSQLVAPVAPTPQGTLGNIWRYFGCHTRGGQDRHEAGELLTAQCAGHPHSGASVCGEHGEQ